MRNLKQGILASSRPKGGLAYTPVLDTYGSAAFAYSMRLVRSAYSGSCIRVRRSSDNAEQDIGFAASGLVDTASMLSFVGSGDAFVVKWYDQSGSGNYVYITLNAAQPKIVSTGTVILENGIPCLEVSEGVHYMQLLNAIGYTGSNGLSIFAVFNANGTGPGRLISQNNSSGQDYSTDGWMFNNALMEVNNSGGPSYTNWSTLNQIIFSGHSSTANGLEAFINGVSQGSDPGTPSDFTPSGPAYLFRNDVNWTGSGIGGKFQELIGYEDDKNDSGDRASIETNQNDYYNVY